MEPVRVTVYPKGVRPPWAEAPVSSPELKAAWPRIQALLNKGNTPVESEPGLLVPMQEMGDKDMYAVVTFGLLVERLERAEARIKELEEKK